MNAVGATHSGWKDWPGRTFIGPVTSGREAGGHHRGRQRRPLGGAAQTQRVPIEAGALGLTCRVAAVGRTQQGGVQQGAEGSPVPAQVSWEARLVKIEAVLVRGPLAFVGGNPPGAMGTSARCRFAGQHVGDRRRGRRPAAPGPRLTTAGRVQP